jgi:glycerol-1-phosphate dehydrogenase [NAD(P)+]
MLVAVGSGTINDLVKLAAHKAGKPYIVFPTAASMNGYVSRNASIGTHGHKQSVAATLPLAVYMDMQVITEAPLRLTQAGLGDSLARPTAQADWLLSHHLLGTAYDDAPYQMIAAYEPMLFAQAGALLHGDRETLECLMKLLLVSGFGMTIAGSSIPASGAEHMVAHILSQPGSLHGEEIAFTSVEMAAQQARLLGQSKIAFCALDIHADEGYSKKRAAILAAYPDLAIPRTTWERAREAIAAIHVVPEKLSTIRKAARLPEHPATLGWDDARYREALATARFTRDRFTCLDVE